MNRVQTGLENIARDINRLRESLADRSQSGDLQDRNWSKFHSLRLQLAEALSARPEGGGRN